MVGIHIFDASGGDISTPPKSFWRFCSSMDTLTPFAVRLWTLAIWLPALHELAECVGGIARCETFGAPPWKKTTTAAQKKGQTEGKNDLSKGVVLGSFWAAVFCWGNTLGLMWYRMWSRRTSDTSRRTKSDEIPLVIVEKEGKVEMSWMLSRSSFL